MKTVLAVIGGIAVVLFLWWALKVALAMVVFGYVGYHYHIPHWWGY